MREQPRVVDAAINREGEAVSLVLIVDYATDMGYAAQLADNFVRQAKAMLKDGQVGKEIGRGKYDYVIGVYLPNKEQLGLGAKARSSDRITW